MISFTRCYNYFILPNEKGYLNLADKKEMIK